MLYRLNTIDNIASIHALVNANSKIICVAIENKRWILYAVFLVVELNFSRGRGAYTLAHIEKSALKGASVCKKSRGIVKGPQPLTQWIRLRRLCRRDGSHGIGRFLRNSLPFESGGREAENGYSVKKSLFDGLKRPGGRLKMIAPVSLFSDIRDARINAWTTMQGKRPCFRFEREYPPAY